MLGQADWLVSVWVWSVLVALDEFNCSLWLEAKSFDVNCTQLKRRSYTARFGSAILLPTCLNVPCVDYFRHIMSEPVSCVCVCMCECRGREIERERERPSKLSRPFSLLPDQKMMTQWWFGQVKHFVFVLYSSHAKRPELRRPQKIRYYAPKSEDRRGFV